MRSTMKEHAHDIHTIVEWFARPGGDTMRCDGDDDDVGVAESL